MFRARNAVSSSHKARDSNASTDGLLGETSGSTSGISLNTNLNTGNTSRFRSSSASSPASSSREVYYLQVPIPGFLVKLYRTATSRSATWKQALPQIAFLSSAALLIWTFVWAIHYIKVSRIYVPAYRTIPLVTEAQTQAASVRHLTHDQCMASFPGLYDEADRVVDYWIRRGGVSMNQVEKAAGKPQTARVLIKDGEMYVKRFEPERHSRTRAALALINDAILTSLEPIPDIEFVIQTDDAGDASEELPLMVLDRTAKQNHLWLMPDYGFGSWPEPKVGYYPEVVRKAQEFDSKMSWEEKVPQLFWKGALLIPLRRNLYDLARQYSWGKIEEVDWRNKDTVITMDEHCGFKYLAHLEGYAYSGRLKYILQCKSVVVAHEMDYIQHFHHLINSTMFSPHQNMVVTDKDWKDLPRIMELLEEKDEFAKDLAEQSQKFWNHYISKQSIDCYWRYLFRRWAEVQRYKPELHYEDTPFASFILLGKTHWDPY